MNKTLLIVLATAVVVGAVAFYSGMKYGASQGVSSQSLQNLSPSDRQQLFQGLRGSFGGGGGRNGDGSTSFAAGRQSGGFTSGEIISKDAQSITIKLRDGSSKIVFYSDATEISKFVNSSASDLGVGQTVSVSGASNQDGSITAQSIQLRSASQTTPAQ